MTSAIDTNPALWEGSEGGRSAGFCQYVFALAYYNEGTKPYLAWANDGRPSNELQRVFTRAVESICEDDERMAYLLSIGERFQLTAPALAH